MHIYTEDERRKAIALLVQYDFQYTKVTTQLGYPSPRELRRWYDEYIKTGNCTPKPHGKKRYTDEQKQIAVQHYLDHGCNYSRTSKLLGYPGRLLLAKWVKELSPENFVYTPHRTMVPCSKEEKEAAVIALCSGSETAEAVAARYGVRCETLYAWKNKFFLQEK